MKDETGDDDLLKRAENVLKDYRVPASGTMEQLLEISKNQERIQELKSSMATTVAKVVVKGVVCVAGLAFVAWLVATGRFRVATAWLPILVVVCSLV